MAPKRREISIVGSEFIHTPILPVYPSQPITTLTLLWSVQLSVVDRGAGFAPKLVQNPLGFHSPKLFSSRLCQIRLVTCTVPRSVRVTSSHRDCTGRQHYHTEIDINHIPGLITISSPDSPDSSPADFSQIPTISRITN